MMMVKRRKLSMMSLVSKRGDARCMIVEGTVNAHRLIEFLETVVKDAGKKVFIIMDNLRHIIASPLSNG